jgi:hypothetical protein
MSDDVSSTRHSSEQQAYDAISSVSAIAYGFMGSQALFAALELGLFTTLAEEPCGLDRLAARLSGARARHLGRRRLCEQPSHPALSSEDGA